MDIDSAPFWANLYISKHKCDFIGNLIEEDTALAKTFHGTFQFIDDLCDLMMEENFKSHTKKFTLRTWYYMYHILNLTLLFLI